MFNLLKISIFPISKFIIWDISPNPGRIKMYTSGCPKNQNKCWKITGFPFPIGLKNIEFIFWSKIIIVIPLANTGIDKINKIDVIIIDQLNNERLFNKNLLVFILIIVMIKFIELKIEDKPFKCKEKIIKFIVILFWIDKGGYNVHPVKILLFKNILKIINIKDGIKIQNLKLFKRG